MKYPSAYLESGTGPSSEAGATPVVADNAFVNTKMSVDSPATTVSDSPDILSKLDWQSWLPFAAKTYHISPDPNDYILKPMILMPTDIPNRNGISFPLAELVKFQPPPMNRQVYRSWVGTPIHIEHDNEDCTKAIGVVIDTALRCIKGFGDDKHWKVFGLLAIDKTKDPKIAQEVLEGKINTGSMGCTADFFSCSVCGAPATKNRFTNCSHITSTEAVNWNPVTFRGEEHIAFLNAHDLSPIEFSIVRDPAWAPALSDLQLNWGGD